MTKISFSLFLFGMGSYWYEKKILRSFIAKILFHITARIFHQLKCPTGFKIRIFDQVIQFGYEIFVRRGYGIQIFNSKNISFLNWKQEMQIVFAMFLTGVNIVFESWHLSAGLIFSESIFFGWVSHNTHLLQGRKWLVGNCPPSFWQNRRRCLDAASCRINPCPPSFR